MQKLEALIKLDSGYMNVTNNIIIYRSFNETWLQAGNFPEIFKGGKYTFDSEDPEVIKQEIFAFVEDSYEQSINYLLEMTDEEVFLKKIEALILLDNGFINLNSGMFINKILSSKNLNFQIADLKDVIKGGAYVIKLGSPEEIRAKIQETLSKTYDISKTSVLKKISDKL